MLSQKARRSSISTLLKSFLISAFLIQITALVPSNAQNNAITPDTSDGTLGTTVTFDSGNYTIKDGTIIGTIEKSNQFHSFGKFNVPENQSATFTYSGPNTIANIIGRVTGGDLSHIYGTVASTIDGANLFLLNPAGIMFGPKARLDVKGSFHASTADFIRLGDGGIFYADPAGTTILKAAPPETFGFLNGNPAGITVDRSVLEVPEGKTLSLVGGDIEIVGPPNNPDKPNLGAQGGRINIASVASPGEVIPNAPGEAADMQVDSFEDLGEIALSQDAEIDAGGPGGGTVVIRGGRLMLAASGIQASAQTTGSGAVGSGTDIKVVEDVVLDDSYIETNVWNGVADASGGVRIEADHLEVSNFSELNSLAFSAGDSVPASMGNTGDIELTTHSLLLRDGSRIRSGTGGLGNAGDIVIRKGSLEIRDAAWIMSDAWAGTGNAGNVIVGSEEIPADSILLSNAKYPGFLTGISPRTYGTATGKAGDVSIHANGLQMLAGTEISTPTFGDGQGGSITLTIDGDISIQGSEILFPWQTGIFANTAGSGPGGSLSLTADNLEMTTKTAIQTATFWTADAGTALIDVGGLELTDRSTISTSGLFGAGGSSGKLEVFADRILISGPESSTDPFGTDFTGLSTAAGSWGGNAGDLYVEANDSLTMTTRASITSSSAGPGSGGKIDIKTPSLRLLNGSQVISSAFGSGDGGNTTVIADTALISGVHPELYTDITGNQSLAPSGIASQSGLSGGNAGEVKVVADRLEISDGGRLSVETFGPGDGGNIVVEAESVLISGINAGLRDLLISSGADPKFAAAGLFSGTGGFFLGDGATGRGGNIEVAAGDIQVREGGLISSETETPGVGGTIQLEADNVTLSGGASITAESRVAFAATTGNAGNIRITAADTLLMQDSAITTASEQASGGNISISAGYMVRLGDSKITTSVAGGPETAGGNINIDPDFVILKNSDIIARAFEGRGGNIRIVAGVFLADPNSTVDASSEKGIDGTVDIRAPISDVTRKVKPLPKRFTSAGELLRESCIARIRGGGYSSFIVGGREGLPLEPGGLLPSPLYVE